MAQRLKLLVVEDEPEVIDSLKENLQEQGYTVLTALDGNSALELARKELPHLILLDLMLPKLDGYKVCRLLKFDERYRGIPILILTARAEARDMQLALECGADAYLTKPFEVQVLLGKLKELLKTEKEPEPWHSG